MTEFAPWLFLVGIYTFLRVSAWMRKVERFIDEHNNKN